MPNVMATLPNIGGVLCSTSQFGWRLLLECWAVMLPRRETRLKSAARGSLKIQDAKMMQKIAISAPSHTFLGLYLRNSGMYRQSEKKLVKQQYLLHMFPQYGELWPRGWDRFGSLGHPSYFQRLPRLGSVTARQSSSERQPNFAALNRGRHLCLAGRPSRWTLAQILVIVKLLALLVQRLVNMWYMTYRHT